MKTNNRLRLFLLLFLLLALSVAVFQQSIRAINLGLDLRGGVYVLLKAEDSEAGGRDAIDRAITVIRNRIDALGIAEPVIQQEGVDRVRIELAGMADQQAAREVIGRTAMLTFVSPEGQVLLTGGDLRDAYATFDQNNMPAVGLEFTAEGTTKFAAATEKLIGQVISIHLDEEVVSAPEVRSVITEGRAIIEGQMTSEETRHIALMLRSGALPVELTELETRAVGPTLGADSLQRSLRAGASGLLLVLLFMLIYYRFLGVVANVALLVYVAIVVSVLAALNAVLTLPGIAGIILSVGMAVDANIVIFERIKEELGNGRAVRNAIEAGFERAFRAILDSNVTTLFAAAVLFGLGTGPVRGFAVTLSIGVLTSMFTAIVLTRFLLRQSVKAGVLVSPVKG
ncbi:MAG: protein translocase subunit SecD [Firmicutes bacterium]|nr:protein translocase subunit SecD [Bacillota bacterium]